MVIKKCPTVPEKVHRRLEQIVIGNGSMERPEHENATSPRAYKVGEDRWRSVFETIKENDCCGSYEDTIEIDGEKWVIGFNYGH